MGFDDVPLLPGRRVAHGRRGRFHEGVSFCGYLENGLAMLLEENLGKKIEYIAIIFPYYWYVVAPSSGSPGRPRRGCFHERVSFVAI